MFAVRQIRDAVARNAAAARGMSTKTNGKEWAVGLIAEDAGVSKAQAERALKALLNGIQSSVVKGEKVTFAGFGTFEQVTRAARAGRNIQTGETVQYPASKAPKFKAGSAFKAAVKGA